MPVKYVVKCKGAGQKIKISNPDSLDPELSLTSAQIMMLKTIILAPEMDQILTGQLQIANITIDEQRTPSPRISSRDLSDSGSEISDIDSTSVASSVTSSKSLKEKAFVPTIPQIKVALTKMKIKFPNSARKDRLLTILSESLNDLTVDELRGWCRTLAISTQGKKSDLITSISETPEFYETSEIPATP